MPEILGKVVGFVTRQWQGQTELLVFDHPSAGIQVPAGTIEAGEAPDVAVVREVFEEGGLECDIVQVLGDKFDDLGPHRRMALDYAPVRAEPSEDSAMLDVWVRRGLPFDLIPGRRKNGFAYFENEIYDCNQDPWQLMRVDRGWIPERILTSRQQRHFYQLQPRDPQTPETWPIETDRQRWWVRWAPLQPPPPLFQQQAHWLMGAIDRLGT